MLTRWFIAGWLLAVTMSVAGQNASICRIYDVTDGLSMTACASVSAGPRGRVLVKHPGADQMSWLDGYEVKKLPVPTSAGERAYESPGGQIWSVWSGGLEEYNGQAWTRYPIPEIAARLTNGVGANARVQLWPTKQGRVLFLLPESLMELNTEDPKSPKSRIIVKSDQTKLGSFTGMAAAYDEGLWVTGQKGLAKVSSPARNIAPTSSWMDILPNETLRVTNLTEPVADEEGGVTVLAKALKDNAKVALNFNGRHWTVLPLKVEDALQAWRTSANSYCVATKETISCYEEDSGSMHLIRQASNQQFCDLAVDAQEVFWVASTMGLFRYAPSTWGKPTALQNLNSPAKAMAEDGMGHFWLLDTNCLHEMHEDHWQAHPFPAKMVPSFQNKPRLFALGNGNVIINSDGQLIQYRPKTAAFEFVTAKNGEKVNALGLLNDGTLCVQKISTGEKPSGRLEVYDGLNFNRFPYPQPAMDLAGATQIFASPGGDLWLSGKRGIARYHRKEWEVFTAAEGSVPEGAICLTEISDGKVWCGTTNKIWEFNGKTWSLIRSGFEQVNDLLKSRDGSIWVATNRGLHRYYQGAWAANGKEEGLPNEEVGQIYEDKRGRIWIGTERGASLYHPEADMDPPQTYVQSHKDRKNSLLEGEVFTVNFSGRDKWKYTPSERLLFSHRLDEQDWSPFQEQQSVTYSDLLPGRHYFQVRAMDRNWNVDPKPALLEFAVTLPWYKETRLALAISGAAAATVFFGGLALNRHRRLLRSYAEVEKQVALRTKELEIAHEELLHGQKMNALGTLAAGIAHDFNNILSIIKGSAQIIEENLENREKIETRVGRIKTVVEQGAGIVRAMLGFSRESDHHTQLCDVNAIVSQTIQLLGDRFLHEVEVKVEQVPLLPEVPASKDFIQQILLNFIFNAAEATPGRKQIVLRTSQTDRLPPLMALAPAQANGYVCISVMDSGSGIPPEVMPRIFEPFFTTKAFSVRRGTGLGLSMVYELARQMHCGLAVDSELGKGSTFTLIIPRDISSQTALNK